MYLEFFIAGLTGFFAWLLLRHWAAFHRERLQQRAGEMLREVQMTRKRAFWAAIVQLLAFLPVFAWLIVIDYFAFFHSMNFILGYRFFISGFIPDSFVFLDLQFFVATLFVLPLGFMIFGRGPNSFARCLRFSFAIHENGILYRFYLYGQQTFIPWTNIEYLLWSPAKKKFYLQRRGHLRFLRRRFSVEDGEAVAELLGRFVEVRGLAGKLAIAPLKPHETPQSVPATEKSRWRFFRFQFDLLSLMLLVLVVASATSWYAYHEHRSRPTKAVVASLAEFKPMVMYHDVDVVYLSLGLRLNAKQPTDADMIALRAFPRLEALLLWGARGSPTITDAGLAEVEPLSHLQMLELNQTAITDAGLLHLQGLANLRELSLMFTSITDAGLANLKPLANLRVLRLSGTNVTDDGLVHLQAFSDLEELVLPCNFITDKGLHHLSPLKNLRKLCLTDCSITDEGLACLKPLEKLEELDLNGTQISDEGLPNLYCLKKLKSLKLNSSQITQSGIALLAKALPNTTIRFQPPPPPPIPSEPPEDSPEEEKDAKP